MRALLLSSLVAAAALGITAQQPPEKTLRFVFTSDAHYGLRRAHFRGRTNVRAHDVNSALVADIKSLGDLDFVVEGGDVANRAEAQEHVQPASVSWAEFTRDYIRQLKTPVYVVPGNHDASNAIGFYRALSPAVDPSAMVGIYNLMMAPQKRTAATFTYTTDRVLTSRDVGGVHFVFMNIWPDSIGRAWLADNLRRVSTTTPVVIFTHDQPEAQNKHFTNPNGVHDINAVDGFENLLSDTDSATRIAEWESFLQAHPNITAYFHGNSNWNEFYDWTGPHHTVALHTFRVDSPMKGHESEQDETRLSFHVATIDTQAMTLTVRERLWNTGRWGDSVTVSLSPAPRLTHN
jgi:predicted MPP superfamily phosphohydrolase